jgi:hypothetical protein
MPTLHKEIQKCGVIFTREDTDHVYVLTCKCYHVWHTHLQKRCVCIIYKVQFFVMVKNQMQDDACVYLNS